MTKTTAAVLEVLEKNSMPLPKHTISGMCNPRMNDHAVSARISDLRKLGYNIKKAKVKGVRFYEYWLEK